jgi:hypothetical protein
MSYKQELTQLHQLLTQVRFHAKDELGLPAEIENLDSYKQVGITSLDLNADIDTQLDAVMTLASDLADVMEAAQRPERPTETTNVSTAETDTQKAAVADMDDWSVGTTNIEATADQQTPAVEADGMTKTAVETGSDEYTPKVIGGYDQEQETTEKIKLVDTSLQQWDEIRAQEERKPVERWGDEDTTSEEPAQAPIDNDGDGEKPAETESSGEQMTLPTP